MNTEDGHIHYFDALRFLASFSVIYMHTAAGPLRQSFSLDWEWMNLCTSFAFTAVPLFLMMSGYLLLSGKKTSDISILLKKRLPRLVIPLIGWTVVAALWNLYSQNMLTLQAFFDLMIQAISGPITVHFWYMYTLIALYALSPILYGGLHALDRKGHIYVLILIALITLKVMITAVLPDSLDKYVALDLLTKLQLFGGHLCTFVLGYYLGKLRKKIPNWVLVGLMVVLLTIIVLGTRTLSFSNGGYTQTFQNQSAGFEVVLAACIFLFFKQNISKPSKFFQAVPIVPLSFSIYLMHNILLSILHSIGMNPPTFLGTLGMAVLNFLICFVVLKTVATIKPLCYLATGMTYSDACQSCNWIYTYHRLKGQSQ